MTDAWLMDANCVHGVAWYDCEECDMAIEGPLPLGHYDDGRPLHCTVCGGKLTYLCAAASCPCVPEHPCPVCLPSESSPGPVDGLPVRLRREQARQRRQHPNGPAQALLGEAAARIEELEAAQHGLCDLIRVGVRQANDLQRALGEARTQLAAADLECSTLAEELAELAAAQPVLQAAQAIVRRWASGFNPPPDERRAFIAAVRRLAGGTPTTSPEQESNDN